MIGFFGDIVFEANDKRILTFAGFQRNSSGRWVSHELIGRRPVTERIGPGLDTISFTITLNGNHGVKPRHEMERWLIKERDGLAETLVIGNKGLGVSKWVVKSVSQMWDVVLNKGEVFSGKVDIELEEYVEVL
ncbi:phage tail protein [Anaerobacillus sp. MEB173]|uniref:phage tail protein n=1 Tax=Anaerobacillus sp. MEB173 TaxID=3383345 RepID=UPI003F8DBCAE